MNNHVLKLTNVLGIYSYMLTHSVTHLHNICTIFTQFGLFQPFLGEFQHVGYQKAYTRAEKFIGGIGRGHRPQEGAEGPKEEAKGLQTGPKAP